MFPSMVVKFSNVPMIAQLLPLTAFAKPIRLFPKSKTVYHSRMKASPKIQSMENPSSDWIPNKHTESN